MTSLLALPNELLQKIASELTYHALLNLERVNQRLHLTCNERSVVQKVARYCFVNTPGVTESLIGASSTSNDISFNPEQLDWQEGDSFIKGTSVEEAKFMGYAAQQCTDVVMGLLGQEEWSLMKTRGVDSYAISRWLPQLLALKHPATLVLEPKALLHVYVEIRDRCPGLKNEFSAAAEAVPPGLLHEQAAEFANITFVMCHITLMHLWTTSEFGAGTIKQFEEFFLSAPSQEESLSTELCESERLDNITERLTKQVPPYNNTWTYACAMLLPMILRLAVLFPSGADHGTLPTPKRIPFTTFMDIRAIYENNDQGFNKCHYGAMTSPQFLAGDWIGCYSDERGARVDRLSSRARYDPPMYGIRLITRARSEQDGIPEEISTIIDERSRGFDAHGEFSLSGTITTTGSVNLAKRYILAGWSWTWTGHVTPFGIFGIWTGLRHFGGHFWIWKEEWL
jgi:hypothetical protein